MNKNIKICFMGSPTFGKNVLEKLIEEYSVVLVVTQPDSYTKGGKIKIEQPVKTLALLNNIPIFQPANIKEDFSMMEEYDFDFLVTAAYGQFIPLSVLHLPKIITLNVHGSDLPRYRGGAPIQRAIMAGDEYLGVSVMRTILKMDAGVVYKKSLIKLEDDDNYETMIDKLSKKGRDDLVYVIDKLYENINSIEPMHQDVSLVTIANNILKNEEFIDFNNDAKDIFNLIRALNPNPVAKFILNGEQYQVFDSKVVDIDNDSIPGTILENKKELIIKCKSKSISILSIKPQGKNKMDIKSFLNGYNKKFKIGNIIK